MKLRVFPGLKFSIGLPVALLLGASALAFPSQYEFGTTVLDKTQIERGLVIFSGRDGVVYAIGPAGNVQASWASSRPDSSFAYTRPLPNGNLLARLNRDDQVPTITESGFRTRRRT